MDEEMWRKASGGDASTSQSTTALSVEKKGRGQQRGRSRGPAARSKSRGRYRDPVVDECWFCNKPGHRKVNCEEFKKKLQEERSGANVVCTNTQLTSMCLSTVVNTPAEMWFVDSGASFHCTPSREAFSEYVASDDLGHVVVGNGQKCPVRGKGTVVMRWHGQQLRLRDTMHIPNLSKNLISTSVLDREGYATTFGGGEWKITRGSRVIVRGSRDGSLYILKAENLVLTVTAPDAKASTLWHRRLGHLGEKGVKQLHSRNLLPGLKKVELDFCEDCVYGKQKAVSFQTQGRERKGERLELVHSDVWGPAQEHSYGGKRWFVTFIDDATRKV
ncbi:GAG-pre-integrase domain-containing protein [Serratia marcescens]|nr:GAG-pre-integrase domain-containing protein [Serratia marcescens]